MSTDITTCQTCNGRGSVPGHGPPSKDNPPHMPNFIPRETCETCKGSGEVLMSEGRVVE